MPEDLVDQLLAHTGVYIGSQHDPTVTREDEPSVARITVGALPGGAGVAFDYEVLHDDGTRPHVEHTLLARTPSGLALVTAHTHANVVTVLPETEPGYFEDADGSAPFPMAIRIEVPESGRIVYSWSYGRPGDKPEVRDIGDVRLLA